MKKSRWTKEYINSGEVHCHKIKKYLYQNNNAHQKIEIVETDHYGIGLFLDGRLQHVAYDEYIYSESMVHPLAIVLGEKCKNVLVVGGGPGGVIRELLKHNTINSITQVEIDASIIKLTKKYLPHIAQNYHDDPRVNIVIADINDYVSTCNQLFDMIIYDVSEPLENSPAQNLFNVELLIKLRTTLSAYGVFVTWAGSAGPCSYMLSNTIIQRINSNFSYTTNYLCHPQSYGTSWLIAVGSLHKIDPLKRSANVIDQQIAKQIQGPLRLYDGSTHHHMFLIPKDVRNYLREKLSTDDIKQALPLTKSKEV